MTKWMCALALLACVSTNVLADADESYVGYDSIVNELTTSAEEMPAKPARESNEWEEVALHGGVGLATSFVSVDLPDGGEGSGLLTGFQFFGGMNLFSREVRGEGLFTSYERQSLGGGVNGGVKEFDLRLVYLPRINPKTVGRLGLGLAARYMDVSSVGDGRNSTYSFSTPSTLLMLGLERKLSKSVTFGPDLSYRSAMTANTYEKSSWDASLRLNATF